MEVVLALDIGSSSIRCTAYYADGSEVDAIKGCSSSIKVRSVHPGTGKIRLAFETETLLDKIDQCLDNVVVQLRHNHGSSFRVTSVGFSTFVMNLLAVDESGNVLGEDFTLSYSCNSPDVVKECQDIRNELSSDELDQLYQKTGAPLHSSYALPQMRALYRKNPTAADKIHRWQSIASLCIAKWTGNNCLPISFSEASWTGLLNFRDCVYEPTALALLPPSCVKSLPPLADFTDALPGIPDDPDNIQAKRYRTLWPELTQSSFFLGLGDGACANVGSKCATASRIAVTIGTSAAARICLRQGVGSSCTLTTVPKGLFCYRISRNHLLVGGALTDGGSVIEWVSKLLNLSTAEAFLDCVDQTQSLVDAQENESCETSLKRPNLTMIPYFSGERSPGFRDSATGAIVGLTLDTTPAHLFKSCLESVSLRLRAILKLVEEARQSAMGSSESAPFIVASGKSLEVNSLWRQMVADSSGMKVVLDLETQEGSSRGVARLLALGQMSRDAPIVLVDEEIGASKVKEPRPWAIEYFNRAAESQERFLDSMSSHFE